MGMIRPIFNKPEARFYSREKTHMSVRQSVYDTKSNNTSCMEVSLRAQRLSPPFLPFALCPSPLFDTSSWLTMTVLSPFCCCWFTQLTPPGHSPLDVKWLKITSGLMPSPQKTPKASDVAPHEASVAFSSILILLRPEDIYHYTHTHHVPHNSLWCELVTRPQRTNTSLTSVSIFHCLRFNSMRDGRKAAKYDREENAR